MGHGVYLTDCLTAGHRNDQYTDYRTMNLCESDRAYSLCKINTRNGAASVFAAGFVCTHRRDVVLRFGLLEGEAWESRTIFEFFSSKYGIYFNA